MFIKCIIIVTFIRFLKELHRLAAKTVLMLVFYKLRNNILSRGWKLTDGENLMICTRTGKAHWLPLRNKVDLPTGCNHRSGSWCAVSTLTYIVLKGRRYSFPCRTRTGFGVQHSVCRLNNPVHCYCVCCCFLGFANSICTRLI